MIKKVAYYLLILMSITSCAQEAEDTIRLIPEGYEGAVLIIFNQKDGESKEYDDDKRVYRIPKNGILRTQFKPNYGVRNHQFFYVNSNNERIEISFVMVQGKKELSKNNEKVYAYWEKAIGESFGINTENKEYTVPPAITFYIGNLADIDKDYQEQLNFIFRNHKN